MDFGWNYWYHNLPALPLVSLQYHPISILSKLCPIEDSPTYRETPKQSVKFVKGKKATRTNLKTVNSCFGVDNDCWLLIFSLLSECDQRKLSVCSKFFYHFFKYCNRCAINWSFEKNQPVDKPWKLLKNNKYFLPSWCVRKTGRNAHLIVEITTSKTFQQKIKFDQPIQLPKQCKISVKEMKNCANYLANYDNGIVYADGCEEFKPICRPTKIIYYQFDNNHNNKKPNAKYSIKKHKPAFFNKIYR